MDDEVKRAFRHSFNGLVLHENDLDNFLIPCKKRVDLTVALKHVHDWKVDWDKNLNEEQIQFVKDHAQYMRRLTRIMFRSKPICDHCGALENLQRCSACKSTMYCSQDCLVADRKFHKEACKRYMAMRNSEVEATDKQMLVQGE